MKRKERLVFYKEMLLRHRLMTLHSAAGWGFCYLVGVTAARQLSKKGLSKKFNAGGELKFITAELPELEAQKPETWYLRHIWWFNPNTHEKREILLMKAIKEAQMPFIVKKIRNLVNNLSK